MTGAAGVVGVAGMSRRLQTQMSVNHDPSVAQSEAHLWTEHLSSSPRPGAAPHSAADLQGGALMKLKSSAASSQTHC